MSFDIDKIDEMPVIGSSLLNQDGQVTWEPQAKPKGFNPTGHWMQWSTHQKRVFKKIAGESLVRLGYAEDLNW